MFLKIKKVLEKYFFCDKRKSDIRNVVQPGRTLRSGRRGRWFESSHSDQLKKPYPCGEAFLFDRRAWDLTGRQSRLSQFRRSQSVK